MREQYICEQNMGEQSMWEQQKLRQDMQKENKCGQNNGAHCKRQQQMALVRQLSHPQLHMQRRGAARAWTKVALTTLASVVALATLSLNSAAVATAAPIAVAAGDNAKASAGSSGVERGALYEQGALYARGAAGDLTQVGGARRTHDKQTSLYAAALKLAERDHAQNVILLIGDGMGDSEITAARNFAMGAGGYFKGLDALPFTGQYTHYSLDQQTHKPNYVTDSAASATAWSTGVKSYNGAIGVDVLGKAHTTLLELAKANGFATGNVSTAEIEDATPAAQIAHVTARKCYGPEATSAKCPSNALENGGLGSIAEQLLLTRPDITLGGGAKTFQEKAKAGEYQGKTLLEQARALGYQVVTTADELAKVTEANQTKPVLGLFAPGNMPIRLKGPQATFQGNLQNPPVHCELNSERTAAQPTLAHMTKQALDLLSSSQTGQDKGFFLQVEGASIDTNSGKHYVVVLATF